MQGHIYAVLWRIHIQFKSFSNILWMLLSNWKLEHIHMYWIYTYKYIHTHVAPPQSSWRHLRGKTATAVNVNFASAFRISSNLSYDPFRDEVVFYQKSLTTFFPFFILFLFFLLLFLFTFCFFIVRFLCRDWII